MWVVTVCIIFTFFIYSLGQNCKTPGEWCGDTYQCCGGCCINNICINTYDDCRRITDPCFNHYCPPDEICHLYKPLCEGCEIEKQCVKTDSIPTSMIMNPDTFPSSSIFHTLAPTLLYITLSITTLKLCNSY